MSTSGCHSVSGIWRSLNSHSLVGGVAIWRRCLATTTTSTSAHSNNKNVPRGASGGSFSWRLAVLEPHIRCPLPGDVGIGRDDFDHRQLPTGPAAPPPFVLPASALPAVSVLPPCQDSERSKTVQEAFNLVEETFPVGSYPRAAAGVRFSLAACPQVLKKHLTELFPRRSLDSLTVITLALRGGGGVGSGGELHQSLLDSLVMTASEICQALRQEGFWSDFIDPVNGRPFLSVDNSDGQQQKPSQLQKQQQQQQQQKQQSASSAPSEPICNGVDFEIADLGFCKLVLHKQSRQLQFLSDHNLTPESIGSQVFTDAPLDHPLLLNLIKPSPTS